MANRARGRVQRGRQVRGQNVWSVVLWTDLTIASGGLVSVDVISDSDWVPAGGTARATIKRTRGWAVTNSKDDAAAHAFNIQYLYLGVYDEDEASLGGELVSTYVDEDIMWTGGGMQPFQDAAFPGSAALHWEVDSKAQRRIKNGQELRFVITNVSTDTVETSGVMRSLLTRGS